jgi:hypothetical protein
VIGLVGQDVRLDLVGADQSHCERREQERSQDGELQGAG